MQPLDLKNHQSLLLELLDYIDRICHQENLRYSLCGGTLLGAAREGAILAWDDDADVMMPRTDYEKFLKIAHADGEYTLLDRQFQQDYYYHFAKLSHPKTTLREDNVPEIQGLGVFVDIFPADPFPHTPPEVVAYMRRLTNLRRMWWHAVKLDYADDPSATKRIVKRLFLWPYALYCKARGIQHWYDRIDAMLRDPANAGSSIVGFPIGSYKERDIFTADMFEHYTTLPLCGREMMCIRDWDVYLSSLYGDYMTPPPPEKRKIHGFPAYSREEKP